MRSRAPLLLICLALPGCGKLFVDRSPSNAVTVSGAPNVDFGSLSLGFTASQTLTLTNTSGVAIDAFSVSGLNAPFSYLGGSYPGQGGTCTTRLEARGGSCTLVLAFAPSTKGIFTADVSIGFDDGTGASSVSREIAGAGEVPLWTWIQGSLSVNAIGSYGTQGTSSPFNYPGSRYGSGAVRASTGSLLLFGGQFDPNSYFNDLWKFDGTSWTWISGDSTVNPAGSYGAQGTPAATNHPGGRAGSALWIDSSDQLWIFGGQSGATDYRGDLWRYDGANWTWIAGDSSANPGGSYGTQGTAASSNQPGARAGAAAWRDSAGALWIFGGLGYVSSFNGGRMNDLWKFDGANWTWISGANQTNQPGSYGSRAVASSTNSPGARDHASVWVDSSGNAWLFGGYGYDASGAPGLLDDLWKFDGANWTWIAGSSSAGEKGSYGSLEVPSSSNHPGARSGATSWIDSNGMLWLFGGNGLDSSGASGELNDLWKFDGANWTWVSGSSSANQAGVYGTRGVAGTLNGPGAREQAAPWIDSNGDLRLFGGLGEDSGGHSGALNDFWRIH